MSAARCAAVTGSIVDKWIKRARRVERAAECHRVSVRAGVQIGAPSSRDIHQQRSKGKILSQHLCVRQGTNERRGEFGYVVAFVVQRRRTDEGLTATDD